MDSPRWAARQAPFLYFVTPGIGSNLEEWLALVQTAAEAGVHMIQMRDKTASHQAFLTAAKRLQSLLRGLDVPLIINDRVEIAQQIGADGVHVGQGDMAVGEVRRLLGNEAIVGVSLETGSLTQKTSTSVADFSSGIGAEFEADFDISVSMRPRTLVEELSQNWEGFLGKAIREQLAAAASADYVAASPVFATSTKQDTSLPWGLKGLSELRRATSLPIVAIGGIKADGIPAVVAAGANGIAVVSAIADDRDPKAAVRTLLAALKQ